MILTTSPLANGPATKLLAESTMKRFSAGSQLSRPRSRKKPSGLSPPGFWLGLAGVLPPGFAPRRQATCGGSVSWTVTVNEHVCPLLAVQVTVVAPLPNVEPGGG